MASTPQTTQQNRPMKTTDNTGSNAQIPAKQAAQQFLTHRREEVEEETVKGDATPVNKFAEWCDRNDKNLSQLNGFDLQEFYNYIRSDQFNYSKVTLRNYMGSVRLFLKFLERVEVVPENVSQKVPTPNMNKSDWKTSTEIDPERVKKIVEWLEKFEYASRSHIVMLLLWRCGLRTGSLHSLDLDDFTDLGGEPVLRLKHRPETGTKLKNGLEGERPVNLTDETAQIVQDYINHKRNNVEDDHGRKPLITTKNGRINKSVIRTTCYKWTCPQHTKIGACECGEKPNKDDAVHCLRSVSPHVIRQASITYWRSQDVPVEVVSDRMNVSREVIEHHYDRRTEEGKAKQRRKFLDGI